MSDDETKQLLREIRDLQKAHFDRYVQFTQNIMDSQREAESARREREQADTAYLEEQTAFQREMRELTRRSHRMSLVMGIVLAVVFGGAIVMYVVSTAIREIATSVP